MIKREDESSNTIIGLAKAVEKIESIHQVQLLTYLKLSNLKSGLVIHFNILILKDGLKRFVNNLSYFDLCVHCVFAV